MNTEDFETGKNVEIADTAVVYPNVEIGSNTIIEDFCVVGHPTKSDLEGSDPTAKSDKVKDLVIEEPKTKIGSNSIIRSNSVIYSHTSMGDNFKTGHGVLIREHTNLGAGCVVGTDATLDGYISVDDKSQVQSHAYLAQSVRVGKGVFIAPGCEFFNNKKIILSVEHDLEGAEVGDFVRIGGGSEILPKVKIGKNALVGTGSVVANDVDKNSVVFGNPAKFVRELSEREIENYKNSTQV